MKIYTEPVVCSICGRTGLARPRDAATEWLGKGLRHSDPEVCANNLRRKANQLKKREEELKAKEDNDKT